MTFPVVYDTAHTPTRGPQPGAIDLRDWILVNYPDLGDLGIYNNRPVRGGSSLSTHAEGRGIDIGTPSETAPTEPARATGRVLADLLVEHHAALGVQQIIFDRRLWRNTRAAIGWRPYAGKNPHRGHLHIELTRAAASGLTPQLIADTLGGTTMPTAPATNPLVVKLQESLAAAGHDPGAADGIYGPRTHTAAIASLEDDTIDAKAEAADALAGAYRQLMEATS